MNVHYAKFQKKFDSRTISRETLSEWLPRIFKTLIHFQTSFSWLQPRLLSGLHPSMAKYITHSKQGCQVIFKFINVRNIVRFFQVYGYLFYFYFRNQCFTEKYTSRKLHTFETTPGTRVAYFSVSSLASEDTSMMSFPCFSWLFMQTLNCVHSYFNIINTVGAFKSVTR